jgi:hypothetical protein
MAARGLAAAAAAFQFCAFISHYPPQHIGGVHAPTERTSVRAGDAAAAVSSVLRTRVARAKRIVGGGGGFWCVGASARVVLCVRDWRAYLWAADPEMITDQAQARTQLRL